MPKNKQEARFKAIVKTFMVDGYKYEGMVNFEDGVSYEVFLSYKDNKLRIVNDVVRNKIIVYKNNKYSTEYNNV